jgi:hypothetical protein
MDNKAAMLEAVKRKRYMIQSQSESLGPKGQGGEGSEESDELAPEGSASKDALLGKPVSKDSSPDTRDSGEQGETALGQEGGFDHEEHKSPENSKNLFLNPKKDTHDAVDLNKNRNMAGSEGENTQHDEMGVDAHRDVRLQSSNMAKKNAFRAEGAKDEARKTVKGQMAMPNLTPSQGEEAGKDSPEATKAEEGSRKPASFVGMKGARAKLDKFFGKK